MSFPSQRSVSGGGVTRRCVLASSAASAVVVRAAAKPAPARQGDSSAVTLDVNGREHVLRIDPRTTLIKEESVPPGAVEGWNSARGANYAGPCPPPGHGIHHYHFKLYALDTTLDLPESAMIAGLPAGIAEHVLAETELVGTYERK